MDRANYDRILGRVLGRSCVLLNCFDAGTSTTEAGPGEWEVNARLFVNAVLLGPRKDADAPAELFTGASARFHGLPEFDGRMPFQHGRPALEDGGDDDPPIHERMTEQLTVRGLEWRKVETDRAAIEFVQGTGSHGKDFKSSTLVSRHWMRVFPHEALPLDDLIDLFTQARTLIAIALHQDCRLYGPITLRPERMEAQSDSDDFYTRPYEYHARWRRGTRHSFELYNRIMSYDSLGPDGIARWLALEGECGHVISRLSSLRYARKVAFEDAILRVVAAADSLHRVVYPLPKGKGWIKARSMLKELAEYAGYPFRDAVPHLDDWAHAVIYERDNAAHNKGRVISKPALTTELVESVYMLVLIALLRRADAPDTAFEGVRHSQPFIWPMKRIFKEFGGGDDWIDRMGSSPGTLGG